MSTMSVMSADKTPEHKSSRAMSVGSPHTRRSNRSRSRSRDRKERRRESRRAHDERRRSKSPGRDRSHRRSRSRERSHRDKDGNRDRDRDRERDKDRERRHESGSHRDRDRTDDRDRDERRERRRKRAAEDADESPEAREKEERSKRKRDTDDPTPANGSSSHGTHGDHRPSRDRSRDSIDRRHARDYRERKSGPGSVDYDGHRPPRDEREPPRRDYDSPRREPAGRSDRDRFDPPERHSPGHRPPSPRRSPPPPPPRRRPSPTYEYREPGPYMADPEPSGEDDSEARSVFVSQLAARLTARDLGMFFEDKLGEGCVKDARIVTDRLSRRSKGIAYVEFRSIDLVSKAIALSGTIVMGLPIMVQLTESERNRLHAGDNNLNLPPGVSAPHHGGMQLYVGSLHFNLTEHDIKQVFEPFGELEFVDLHRDPMTGRSKGYAFVQYKRPEDAKMALEQMEGFELAGRTLRVNTVHEKSSSGVRTQHQDSLDEAGGGNLNAASRQALMQKLARIDPPPSRAQPIMKPNIPQAMSSRSVLLKNMFDPEEETERDWDKELAEDVKGECEEKYGPVDALKVEKESQGEIYVKFTNVDSASKAIAGLNGRWFGGKQVSATFISDAMMQAHQ